MKWVFDRYTTVTRFHRSSVAVARTEGVFYNRISCCSSGTGCVTTIDGKTVTITGFNCSASNATSANFTIDEDQ